MNSQKGVWKASAVFAPDYPRQTSSRYTIQKARYSRSSFCDALQSATEYEMPGYYSVYSFPRGHSNDRNIPKVDCIFIDLDLKGNNYNPNRGKTDFKAWRKDMSALLIRSRMIASTIIEEGQQEHFRATLSGHKGLHLYLDFPTIAPSNGSFRQFKIGLSEYSDRIMSWLDTTAGGLSIDKWVDVDGSDLGRLARHPNTIHHTVKYDDEERWCVPITIEELAGLTVDDYLSLTQSPRWIDGYSRNPSIKAGNRVVQAIRNAVVSNRGSNSSSEPNSMLIKYYDHELDDKWYNDIEKLNKEEQDLIANFDPANEDIEIEDIPFLTANKPCIESFRNRDDSFLHGNESHIMETSIISNFVEMGVPRSVMHEFFSEIDGYSERETNDQIDTVIERTYNEFNCKKIADKASRFCLDDGCKVYQRNDDIQK